MKKLLLFLLIPFFGLAQDAYLSHSYIDPHPIAIGDTISVKFEGILMQATPDYIMFDFQWNNKLLEYVSHTFNPDNAAGWDTNNQTSFNKWNGYKFNPNPNVNVIFLDDQYDWWNGGHGGVNTYPSDADWSVGRVTIQGAATLPSDTPWIYVKFKLKDKQGTNFNNYSNITSLNWARFADFSAGSGNYDLRSGNHNISIDEANIGGLGAGTITINLNTPAKANHATDFGYSLYSSNQLDANGYPAQGEIPIHNGTFDANGQVQLTDLTIGETYWIHTHVVQTPTWLDEVLTVTDAYYIFQEAISAGDTPGGTTNKFEYQIQYEIGEVNNSGNVDFQDSYVALAHISGVDPGSTWFTSVANGAFNLSGMTDTFGVSSNEYYFGLKHTFTVDANTTTVNVAHAFKGDPDFSHSFVPTANGATTGNTMTAKTNSNNISLLKTNPIDANLDISSILIDGKVIVEINLAESGVVGMQLDITYDKNILTFENGTFDTGNEMTNFLNHKLDQSKIFVGSLDQSGKVSVKTGTPYKLVFTPKQTITNTIGLVTFKFVEGVKSNGTKVNFNIQ